MKHIKGIVVTLIAIALPFLIGYAILWANDYYGDSTLRGVVAVVAVVAVEMPLVQYLARNERRK